MKTLAVIAFFAITAISQSVALIDKAWNLASESKFDQAAVLYEQAVAANPQDARSLANLGWCYLELKRYQDSADMSRRAIAADPKESYAFNNLGYALIMLDQPEAALEPLRTSIKLNAGYEKAYSNLIYALGKLDRAPEAVTELRAAIAVFPQKTTFRQQLINLEMKNEWFLEAIRDSQELLKLEPFRASDFATLGAAYELTGQHEKGLEAFKQAAVLEPDNINFLRSYAHALMREHKDSEAITVLQQILTKNPRDFDSLFAIATRYSNLRKLDEALEFGKKALEVQPDSGGPMLLVGLTLASKGDKESAAQYLAKLKEINPHFAEILEQALAKPGTTLVKVN